MESKEIKEFEVTRTDHTYLYAKNELGFEFRINKESTFKLRTHIGAGIVLNAPLYTLTDIVNSEALIKGYIENDEIILVPYKSKN